MVFPWTTASDRRFPTLKRWMLMFPPLDSIDRVCPSLEAAALEGGDDLLDVLAVAGLQDHVDLDVLHRDLGEGALVVDFLDARVLLGDARRHSCERARQVAHFHHH